MSKLDEAYEKALQAAKTVSAPTPKKGNNDNLWKLRKGTNVQVPFESFDNDFKVLLDQLLDEVEPRIKKPVSAMVRVRDLADFRKWAKNQEPDWDRYPGVLAQKLFEAGKIGRDIYSKYDSVDGFKALQAVAQQVYGKDAYTAGFGLYIESLAEAIKAGVDLPPLVTLDGEPADGRHRALATIMLKRKYGPTLEILEIT